MSHTHGRYRGGPSSPSGRVVHTPADGCELEKKLAQQTSGTDADRLAAVLSDPQTPSGVLAAALATRRCSARIEYALVQNPSLPMSALFVLGQRYPVCFMDNPVVRLQRATSPGWLLSIPRPTLCAVIRSEACPRPLLSRLASRRRFSIIVRAIAAARSDLSEKHMVQFMRHGSPVRVALASNPALPSALAHQLARDKNARVRAGIAKGTRDTELLQLLSRDRSIYNVRVAVAGNLATPPAARAHLSRSKLRSIQKALQDADLRRGRDV